MKHYLCMVPHDGVKHEAVAEFLDSLEHPFEWMELPPATFEARVVVVRCETIDELTHRLNIVPDRNVVRAFGFSTERYDDGTLETT